MDSHGVHRTGACAHQGRHRNDNRGTPRRPGARASNREGNQRCRCGGTGACAGKCARPVEEVPRRQRAGSHASHETCEQPTQRMVEVPVQGLKGEEQDHLQGHPCRTRCRRREAWNRLSAPYQHDQQGRAKHTEHHDPGRPRRLYQG